MMVEKRKHWCSLKKIFSDWDKNLYKAKSKKSKTIMKSFDEVKADILLFLLPTQLPFASSLLSARGQRNFSTQRSIALGNRVLKRNYVNIWGDRRWYHFYWPFQVTEYGTLLPLFCVYLNDHLRLRLHTMQRESGFIQ